MPTTLSDAQLAQLIGMQQPSQQSQGAGIVSGLTGLAGLGLGVATALPGTQQSENERILGGIARGQGGSGYRTGQRLVSDAARQAIAAAAQGQGATRALQLRSALRQAGDLQLRGAMQGAEIAAREQQQAIGQAEAMRQQRNQNLQRLGSATAGSLGALGAQLTAAMPGSTPGTPAAPQSPVAPVQAQQAAPTIGTAAPALSGPSNIIDPYAQPAQPAASPAPAVSGLTPEQEAERKRLLAQGQGAANILAQGLDSALLGF